MKSFKQFQTGQRLTRIQSIQAIAKVQTISFILLVTMLISSLAFVLMRDDSFAVSVAAHMIRQKTSDMLLSDRPITVTNNTDLILFLHFHKAGGSTIVAAAKRNQNLHLPNKNGNVYTHSHDGADGQSIKFWTFPLHKMRMFLSYLRSHDTTFIAVENKWFGSRCGFDERLKEEYRMKLVTQIRDPFSRYVSNFFFTENGSKTVTWHTKELEYHGSLMERLRGWHRGSHLNMYIRVLSMKWNQNVTEEDLDVAKRELDKFDLVVVMEMDDAAKLWRANHGFNLEHRKANIRYEEIYAAERKADSDFDEKMERFRMEYEHWNRFDYALYEYAKELHRRFAAELSR